jgi:hypothetical protein
MKLLLLAVCWDYEATWKGPVMKYLLLSVHQSYQWRDDDSDTVGPEYHWKKECECFAPVAGSDQHAIDF